MLFGILCVFIWIVYVVLINISEEDKSKCEKCEKSNDKLHDKIFQYEHEIAELKYDKAKLQKENTELIDKK